MKDERVALSNFARPLYTVRDTSPVALLLHFSPSAALSLAPSFPSLLLRQKKVFSFPLNSPVGPKELR